MKILLTVLFRVSLFFALVCTALPVAGSERNLDLNDLNAVEQMSIDQFDQLIEKNFLTTAKKSVQKIAKDEVKSPQKEYDPLLVVVIMVKNEASVIQETLQPFVDGGLNHFLVMDTGSTDSTVPVTQAFFKKHNIAHGVIKQEPFVDFAISRSRSMELAQEAFPNAGFTLVVDAEWYMHGVQGLIKFCKDHQNGTTPLYLVRIMNEAFDNYTPRLFRSSAGLKFVGAVHEVPNWSTLPELYEKVQPETYFEWRVSAYGNEKSKNRWIRDLEVLLNEYEKNPLDPRTVFYLGQTYDCLGDLENARIWYEKRVAMNQFGWDEENFHAIYRLGHVYNELGMKDQAVLKYLEAYSFRPTRAEPLICLADHCWKTGQKELCYLFASRAVEIPYPSSDILFIDKKLYDYTRYDLLGIGSWYVGKYKEGEFAVRQALLQNPNAPHLHDNLALYLEKGIQIKLI